MRYADDSTDNSYNFIAKTNDPHLDFIAFLTQWIEIDQESSQCQQEYEDEEHDMWHHCMKSSHFDCGCKSGQELSLIQKALTSLHGMNTLSKYMSLGHFSSEAPLPCECHDFYTDRVALMYGDELLLYFEITQYAKWDMDEETLDMDDHCIVEPYNAKMCLSLFGNSTQNIPASKNKRHTTQTDRSQRKSCHCGLLEIDHKQFPTLKRLTILNIWRHYPLLKSSIQLLAPKCIQQIFIQNF